MLIRQLKIQCHIVKNTLLQTAILPIGKGRESAWLFFYIARGYHTGELQCNLLWTCSTNEEKRFHSL